MIRNLVRAQGSRSLARARISGNLARCVVRVPADCVDSLDKIAEDATDELGYDVNRATVVRAAFAMWFASIKGNNLQPILSALRAARVKRGRKPNSVLPPYRAPGEESVPCL